MIYNKIPHENEIRWKVGFKHPLNPPLIVKLSSFKLSQEVLYLACCVKSILI